MSSQESNQSTERVAAQAHLAMLDAVLLAADRRDEVMSAISSAADHDSSLVAIRSLLGVDQSGAQAVLDMQLFRFSQAERDRISQQREDAREWLESLPVESP